MATNSSTELPSMLVAGNSDFVQFRKEGGYYIVDIGKSEQIQRNYDAINKRIDKAQLSFRTKMQAILKKLQEEEGILSTDDNSAITPCKSNRGKKRPVPNSSSVNKIVIQRGKPKANKQQTVNLQMSSNSTSHIDGDTLGAKVQDGLARIEKYVDMMSELSIDTSRSCNPQLRESNVIIEAQVNFIAAQQSVCDPSTTIIAEESASVQAKGMLTRAQAKLASTNDSTFLVNATKTISASKSKRTRKAKNKALDQIDQFTETLHSCSNENSSLNTPFLKKGSKKVNSASKPSAGTPGSLSKLNVTPAKRGIGAPSSGSNLHASQERLILSANKLKKAEDNKKAFLENKANNIKTSRQKRTEKIQQNKQALEKEKEIKLAQLDLDHHPKAAAPDLGTRTTRQNRAEARIIERRLKLAKLQEQNEAKKIAASKASGPKNNKAPAKKAAKTKVNGSKNTPKKIEVQANEEKQECNLEEDRALHTPMDVLLGLSPIKKTSVLNGAINETFTCPLSESATNHSIPPPNIHSTLLAASTSANPKLSKLLQDKLNQTQSYQMTPPPKERTFENNYDISKYIDSDDEKELEKYEVIRHEKKIPGWCKGKRFFLHLDQQFKLPQEELDRLVENIFPKITLPVPLEEMDLMIKPKYRERTSSVNWRQAKVLQEHVEEQD